MTNSFVQQVVHEEMLETLVGGTEQLLELLTRFQNEIHAVDPNGPRLPTGPLGIGHIYEFSEACRKWCSEHPDFYFDPRIPSA
jgi:hypothetical protein